ncbi:MAG: glucosaminidase domain-containing protein [Bacilli bacterium]|nr:glucosaminidase domain-containing protein [Bacilli bacterium]
MKAKIRSIEKILLSMVVILNVYLVYLNISVSEFKTNNKIKTNANYVETEEIVIVDDVEIEEVIVEEIVYDGKTLNELVETINKSLNSTISNKGKLIASYSLEKGVDPYMATAIMLHETGCKWNCSRLVRECNNVGGQKGKGCGSYSYFNSLDEGIMAFIDNLERNYISYGLTTPEQINPKYAEDQSWAKKVNKYIEEIKAQ